MSRPYLNADVVAHVLSFLTDQADIASAAAVSKTFAAAAARDAAWVGVEAARGWTADGPATAAVNRAAERAKQTAATSSSPPQAPPLLLPAGARARCAALARVACYDCGAVTRRRTLPAAPLTLRLCHACACGYADGGGGASAAGGRRLVAAGEGGGDGAPLPGLAASLPFALDVPPGAPGFAAVRLFRRRDVGAVGRREEG